MHPAPHPTDAISTDLLCIHCGYNLRTLSQNARCPDCGTDVSLTLQAERNQVPLSPGIGKIVAGAWVFTALMSFETLASLYFQIMPYLFPHFWRTPAYYLTLPAIRLISVTGSILGTLLMANSGLAPPSLRRGSPHLPLMWLIFASCWGSELLVGLLDLSIGITLNSRGLFSALSLIRLLYVILPVGLVLGMLCNVYACIFLRGICDRPQLRPLRGCWLPLLIFSTLMGFAILLYALFVLCELMSVGYHMPQAMETVYDIYKWAHFVRDVAEIICIAALGALATRLARQYRQAASLSA